MYWIESDSDIVFRAFCPCFLAHKITEDIRHGACRDFHGEFPSSPQTCVYDSALLLRSGHFWNNAAGAEASMSREVRKIKFLWEKCGSLLLSGALMCRIGMRTLCPCVIWHIMKETEFCQHWAVCVSVCVCVFQGWDGFVVTRAFPLRQQNITFLPIGKNYRHEPQKPAVGFELQAADLKAFSEQAVSFTKHSPGLHFYRSVWLMSWAREQIFTGPLLMRVVWRVFFVLFLKSVPVYIARDERFWFCGN